MKVSQVLLFLRHTQMRQTSSPFLTGELISINFYSCNAGAESAGSEKIKAKETARAPQKFNWSSEWMGEKEDEKIYERRKWLKISKDVYLMGRVWCYQFRFYIFL